MRSPQPLRNGGDNSCSPSHQPRFHSTVAEHKLRRFNSLILVFRLTSFSFSLASSVFMLTNTHGSDSPHWYHYDTFRFVLAANAIVALYSMFEMGASVWEISRGATLFPEVLQIWFDFGHDQVRITESRTSTLFLSLSIIFVCVGVMWCGGGAGVRVPVVVGERGGDVDGEDAEGDGHVYGEQCVLRANGHSNSAGIRGVSVPRVHLAPNGLPRRLFHNQRFAFSPLSFCLRGNDTEEPQKNILGGVGVFFSLYSKRRCDLE
ncbi:CASP protein 4C2 [Spatholobus suberectus]|nr:CASP protein 4C2 [Spatholobus suberectus]